MRNRMLLSWVLLALPAAGAFAAPCAPTATELCLFGQYTVDVTWTDSSGLPRTARAESFPSSFSTSDSGYFWFDDARYPEIVVRMLDGCAVNSHYWVFLGSLTDVEYTLTVTDAGGTATKSYVNSAGSRTVVNDTMALATCPPSPLRSSSATGGQPAVTAPALALEREVRTPPPPSCAVDTTLCLFSERFRVTVDWMDPLSGSGMGEAVPITSHSGAFWFFAPQNLDVAVKIVETCPAFEVHFAGLSNAEYTVQVIDAATGAMQSYANSLLSFSAVGDPTAFPRSCLFGDGFESGDVTAWSSAVGTP